MSMQPTAIVDQVERWLDGYVAAWRGNDPDQIAALFARNALYYTAPDTDPWGGREAIVGGWLGRQDGPSTWRFRHEIVVVAADLAVVQGWTDYLAPARDYSNLWLVRFAPDGRCTEFTKWWMERKEEPR